MAEARHEAYRGNFRKPQFWQAAAEDGIDNSVRQPNRLQTLSIFWRRAFDFPQKLITSVITSTNSIESTYIGRCMKSAVLPQLFLEHEVSGRSNGELLIMMRLFGP